MKLKTLAPAALLALVTLTAYANDPKDAKDVKQMAPPCSSDAGFYVGVYGGVNFSTDYGDKHTVLGGANITPSNVHSDIGGVGGIKAGYRFESFPVTEGLRLQPAVEAEALYIGESSKFATSAGGVGINDSSSYNNAAGFINGIIRFKMDNGCMARFVPYVGIGVGAEYVTSHTSLTTNAGGNFGNVGDQDLDFAAQALAGIDFNLNQHWTIFTEYKFIDALGTNLRTPNVGGTGANYAFKPDQLAQNLATVGVKYNF